MSLSLKESRRMELQEIIELMDARHHSKWFPARGDKKAGYTKHDGRLTDAQVTQHLDGTAAWGLYCNVDEEQTRSRVMVLDFDDKKGEGVATSPTLTVSATLTRLGIPHLIFRSGGGCGFHVWLFFESAHSWQAFQNLAKDIFDSIDEPKTKYVAAGSSRLNITKTNAKGDKTGVEHQIEVFPKGGGFQNVALPCGRESKPVRVVQNGSVSELVECSLDDLAIEFVPVASKQVPPEEIGDNREAAFARFIQKYDVDDRDSWGAAGLALKAAFGDDWARDKWIEWGATSAKHDAAADGEDHWTGLKPKKYSPLSFWRIATRNGYDGPWPGKKKGVTEADIAAFNEEWAIMSVEGRVEYLNLKTKFSSNYSSFIALTQPCELIRAKWERSSQRRVYRDFVLEPLDYDGPGYNLFNGWSVEPEEGDSSLWEKYILDICGGDMDAAHWVTMYLADAVQRPWSVHPGTALALRGDPGTGKSFLGRAMRHILGANHVHEFGGTDQFKKQFNRRLYGKTLVLGEESFFAGDRKLAALLKTFVESPVWEYEQKQLPSFEGKNVHRVIATTNEDQAVHIDATDRRWTILNVPRTCPHEPRSMASRKWWEPYYELVRERPGVVLKYLLDYEVDRERIGFPYHTRAKDDDARSSDPLLELMHEIALMGVCPHDVFGEGKISTKALAEEVRDRGGSRLDPPRRFANQVRDKFGAVSTTRCVHIEKVETRVNADGVVTRVVTKRSDRTGIQMPALSVFRERVARLTNEQYPMGGEWEAYSVPDPDWTDETEADPEDVEAYVREQGGVVKQDAPF